LVEDMKERAEQVKEHGKQLFHRTEEAFLGTTAASKSMFSDKANTLKELAEGWGRRIFNSIGLVLESITPMKKVQCGLVATPSALSSFLPPKEDGPPPPAVVQHKYQHPLGLPENFEIGGSTNIMRNQDYTKGWTEPRLEQEETLEVRIVTQRTHTA